MLKVRGGKKDGIEVFRILKPVLKYQEDKGKNVITLTKQRMYEKVPDYYMDATAVRSFSTTSDESIIFVATFGRTFLILRNNELSSEETYLEVINNKKPVIEVTNSVTLHGSDLQCSQKLNDKSFAFTFYGNTTKIGFHIYRLG